MADSLRSAMKPLPKKKSGPEWKVKLPKGVVSQEAYELRQMKTRSWKPT